MTTRKFLPRCLFALAAAISTASAQLGLTCCNSIAAVFPSGVEFHSLLQSSIFFELNSDRFSNTAILNPSCIFRPTSAEQVSQALKILTASQCQFAIKSGGHMAITGANNINDGVSMDLVWMNQTVLASDRSYVSLGAGSTWSNAYDTFVTEGVAFPGGLCGTTGVGGVSLGGGESYFQPEVGWVVDNVLNYEIVLASGEIVNANQTSNMDLFRALKGGSSNFGIVTKVDVAAFEYDKMWAGQIVVPATDELTEIGLRAVTNFTAQNNEFTTAGVQTVFTFWANQSRTIDFAMASTDGVENPPVLQPFTSLQPQYFNTVHLRTLSNTVHEVNVVQPKGYRELGVTISFVNDADTILKVHEITKEIYATLSNVPDMDYIFFYVPQPQVIEKYSAKRGGNSLGLENVTNDQIVMLLTPRWHDAAYDDQIYAAGKAWYDQVKKATVEMGTDHPYLYLNFAAGFQKPFCGYGPDNVKFLQQTALKYDPDQVFQTLVPGGFKVTSAC